MQTISRYQVGEAIYESTNSLIYRGRRQVDNQPVILKMLKLAYPSPEKIAWFKQEYEMTRSLDLPGVVDVYGLETYQHQWMIALEDFGGESLQLFIRRQPFTLEAFLPLAIQIVEILGQVHLRNVMHKDINPSNIVLNPNTGQLKLIDFGISTRLSREQPTLQNPEVLEGTLAYISPEQTGRMNRTVDYRTDFYSLGVTFYELLTGQLPFPITDPMELVHAHIAKTPPPPHIIKPDLPKPLSDIIMKLMAKNAEDRYQSAYGLATNLEECQRQWQSQGHLTPFPLGQHDVSIRMQIPQKLYGRQAEIETLLAAFERVSQGGSEVMLVSGYAGIGKSALVKEIYKPITQQRGYFIAGKFDQLHRDIPYASLVQAFRTLIRQLLLESEAHLAAWREKLLAALGPNGQVVIEIIPEVEMIVGPQPEVPALGAAEAHHRFHLIFQNFIRVFTQPEHPLVLFVDDLQWADASSLNLLQLLLTAPDSHYLFIIGAYRDNEVSDAHPLMLMLHQIRHSGAAVHDIVLAPLDSFCVNQLIVDTLACDTETARPLTELVLAKTGGNPFFMNEFLKSLDTEGLLVFDSQGGSWQWDMVRIQTRDMTDNVVALMADKVQKLTSETQQVLKSAACIGNQFDLQTLAVVNEQLPRDTAVALWDAMAEGLVLPLSDAYKLMALDVHGLTDEVVVEYKFAHDRIQQATYSLIPEAEQRVLHQQVGQLLLHNTPPAMQEQRIFDIVNQLNIGQELIHRQDERNELARLNLLAGRKAKASAAYQPACHYLQVGVNLLPEDSWRLQYNLTLELYSEAAEAAYLTGDFETMAQLNGAVLKQAKTVPDTMRIHGIELLAFSAQNKLLEGVKAGLQTLNILGISLPEKPTQADILHGLEEPRSALSGMAVEELVSLPEMTDPHHIAAIDILSRLFIPTYNANPELYSLIVFKLVSLSVSYGNTPASARAYAAYGHILCGVVGDIDAGYKFGNLALNLVKRFNAKSIESSTVFLVNTFVRHWKEHIRQTFMPLLKAYQTGLETGDIEYASLSAFGYVFQAFWGGRELTALEPEAVTYGEAIDQLKQEHFLHLNNLYHQAILNLTWRAKNPCRLIGESYDERTMLPLLLEANNVNELCFLFLNKLVLCFLFQEYPQAVEHAIQTEQYLTGAVGLMVVPVFHFYDSLARLAVCSDVESSDLERMLDKVTANQEKMAAWAHHAPMNFLHKFYLVEAERARVLGNASDAREYYDQAIDAAREHQYINEEALANELAAKFYLAKGQARIAQHYLRDAHYAYVRWGAVAKVKDLEARYPRFLLQVETASPQPSLPTIATSTGAPSSTLDFTSVLKASQAIASEIVLDKLLGNLMDIVIENAGAQKGCLILEKDGQWVVEAEKAAETYDVMVLQSIPVGMRQDLPATLIRYVERTKEDVVLNDAAQEGIFTTDPYIAKHQPKSILCTPLMNQGKLTGILYLENNLTAGAFTPDRLAVLNLLSSQEAISIENASLYKSLQEANTQLEDYSRTLEQRVANRTHELHEKNRELEIANQQILAATERKTQFFNNMSHELRTPLDAVIGFSEVLQEQAFGALNDKQQEYVDYILASGNHLLSLINDLLDLAKLDAGMMELQPDAFPLKPLMKNSLVMVRERALEHNITLSLEIAEDIDTVVGDELRVKQILLNLLSNAVKFTPDQGRVGLKATRDTARVRIAVWDTGIGIAPADQQRIFEEFQQVDDRHATKTVGTGLGLALTKKLVELHDSTIEVESQPGRGSTFTFSLPVAETF